MLSEALAYPRSGDDPVKTILLGGILSFALLAIFILPILVVVGYLVRILDATANGRDEAPEFENWGELLVDGVKALVVAFVYYLPPTALFIAAIVPLAVGGELAGATPDSTILTGAGVLTILLLLLSIVMWVVMAYVLFAALANFAYHDDLGAAFDIGTIADAAFTTDYFVAAVLAFIVNGVLNLIILLLTLVTFGLFYLLYIVIGPFINFYVNMVTFRLMGKGFATALGLPTNGADGAEEPPAGDPAV